MLQSVIFRVRQVGVIGFALLLGAISTSSNAAAFRTRFDPQFNTTFSANVVDLWWQGTATISVQDSCVLPGTTVLFPTCGTATLDSYIVNFFNGDPSANGSPLLPSAQNSGPGLPAPSAVYFDALGVAQDMSLGPINLGLFTFGTEGVFSASLSFAINSDVPGSGGPSLAITPCTPTSTDGGIFCIPSSDPYQSEFPARVEWERVPEPASLALVGLALAVLGLARRRMA